MLRRRDPGSNSQFLHNPCRNYQWKEKGWMTLLVWVLWNKQSAAHFISAFVHKHKQMCEAIGFQENKKGPTACSTRPDWSYSESFAIQFFMERKRVFFIIYKSKTTTHSLNSYGGEKNAKKKKTQNKTRCPKFSLIFSSFLPSKNIDFFSSLPCKMILFNWVGLFSRLCWTVVATVLCLFWRKKWKKEVDA